MCQFFWDASLQILLCCYAVSVLLGCYPVSFLLGCQSANSSVLLCCDSSSGLLLYIFSFEILQCVDFFWLLGSQFFWDASLNILLCCYAVSVLLDCYPVSVLLSCQSANPSGLLPFVSSSGLPVWILFGVVTLCHFFWDASLQILLRCYAAPNLLVYHAVSIDTNLKGVISRKS